jgi:ureidoglycolate lyase
VSLEQTSDFLIVDRAGSENNLEEYFLPDVTYRIETIPALKTQI